MTGINPSSYVVNMSKNSAIQHTQTQKGKTELKAHTHIYSISHKWPYNRAKNRLVLIFFNFSINTEKNSTFSEICEKGFIKQLFLFVKNRKIFSNIKWLKNYYYLWKSCDKYKALYNHVNLEYYAAIHIIYSVLYISHW